VKDFFGALEQELHAAAERRPRRAPPAPAVAGWLGAAALTALAAAVAAFFVLTGDAGERATPSVARPDPVGTVFEKGEGRPPRRRRSIVVANGRAPVVGAWQLEFFRSSRQFDPETGEVYEPARLPCLELMAAQLRGHGASGYCGIFPRTPGFSRNTISAGSRRDREGVRRPTVLIVYGQVPTRAATVVLNAPRGVHVEAAPHPGPPEVPGNFYLLSVDPRVLLTARVNWLEANGRPGSRGIRVAPGSAGIEGSRPPD